MMHLKCIKSIINDIGAKEDVTLVNVIWCQKYYECHMVSKVLFTPHHDNYIAGKKKLVGFSVIRH